MCLVLKKLKVWIAKFEKQLQQIAVEANELIDQTKVSINSFFQGRNGIGTYFKNLANGKVEKITPNRYAQSTVEEDKWFSGKCPSEEQISINGIILSSDVSNEIVGKSLAIKLANI